jgi:molybdate/tungstate transport system permease protein
MRRQAAIPLLMVLLAAGLVGFLALPLASILLGAPPGEIIAALGDPELLRSLVVTFTAAILATGLGMLGGVPLAYLLARRSFPGKRLVEGLVDLPVVVPHTAAGIALLMVFGSKGVLGEPLASLGIFFTDRLAGVVVAMLFVSAPFLVNMSREAFALVDRELELNALVEGATTWGSFWHVSLPLAWRGVTSGAMMMWARGVSEFGAVVILAYYPKIVPTLIYELFNGYGLSAARPAAALLILIVLVVFSVLRWLAAKSTADDSLI